MVSASVLLVAENPVVREFLEVNLRHAGYVTVTASFGPALEDALQRVIPDLILVDPPDGVVKNSAWQRLQVFRSGSGTPWLALSGKGEVQEAHGLPTPLRARTLLDRVQAVLRQHAPHLVGDVLQIGGLSLHAERQELRFQGQLVPLLPTEFRLLQFLMTNPERVFSRNQLLDKVWGGDALIGERTVDVTVRRIRAALEPAGMDGHLETVRGSGYRFSA